MNTFLPNNKSVFTKKLILDEMMRYYRVIILIVLVTFFQKAMIFAKTSSFSVSFLSDFYHFNNADLKSYQSRMQAETDDKATFIFSTLSLSYFRYASDSIFEVEAYRSGFWGNDNLEGKDTVNSYSERKGTNPILLKRLSFKYFISPEISIRLGRFRYALGSVQREYFFTDTIDGTLLEWKWGKDFSIQIESDLLSLSSKPEETYLYSNISKDEEQIENFEGDTLSLRYGLALNVPYFKIFGFFIRYSANTQGGADRSENGLNSNNRADGDYLIWGGSRYHVSLNFIKLTWSGAYSFGKNYLYSGTKEFQGYGASAELFVRRKNVRARFSTAYFSENYMGMKALSMSQFLLYTYLGLFSSPYAGAYHFQNQDAKRPKYFIDSAISYNWKKGKIAFSFLQLWDTKSHKNMGKELGIVLFYELKNLRLKAKAGFFIPGAFFKEHSSFCLPRGNDVFYGTMISCHYYFSL